MASSLTPVTTASASCSSCSSCKSADAKAETKVDLFTPFKLRGVTMRNRLGMPPMCVFCGESNGFADDFHLTEYGARAIGGVGLIIVEATAVAPEGRITLHDLGLWNDEQIPSIARVVAFMKKQGATPIVQLAHAGRKAGCYPPWEKRGALVPKSEGGFQIVGPSAIKWSDLTEAPHVLTEAEIAGIVKSFGAAAERAVRAGYEGVEIHAAHGYLLHEFLSPLTNKRTDKYGGSFENRTRLLLEVVKAIRAALGEKLMLVVRISATDWMDEQGGWNEKESIELCKLLKALGVDMMDVSSGGIVPEAKYNPFDGYQIPFAEHIRAQVGIPTAAVGQIKTAEMANEVIVKGQADMALVGRELLRQPNFMYYAAKALGKDPVSVMPNSYKWCIPKGY